MRKIIQLADLFLRKTLVPLNGLQIKNNPSEENLIKELRKRIRNIKISKNANLIHDKWLQGLMELRKQILNQDPKKFLQWDMIRTSMFVGNAFFTLREFLYLRQNNWKQWKKAIVEKKYLHTEPYLLYPKSNGNTIHQAYHLARFEKISRKKIKDFDFIFEYGGGYGNMCQLVHNLGFKGRYIIFDFPIMSALQNFFLKMNGLNVSFSGHNKKAKIFCLSKISDVEKIITKTGNKLFIATWSLSESPIEARNKVYSMVEQMDYHLISYQYNFAEIDNNKYFDEYQKKIERLHWWSREITQLKGNYYLFGFR